MIRLLYPSDPFDAKRPDENYQEEYDAAKAAGMLCALFSSEDFEGGVFRPIPRLEPGDRILYRGWMLSTDQYSQLCAAISSKGALSVTSAEQYAHCHYLPNWYESCKEFTPETVFLQRDSDFSAELRQLHWQKYFVKDFVKSLTTSRGSVAEKPEQVVDVVNLIETFRGKIEGGVCVRRFEELLPETEERYFVFAGRAYGRTGTVPPMVDVLAKRIPSPFFTADVVSSKDGALRLIELGDGQVSDRKQWSAAQVIQVLGADV